MSQAAPRPAALITCACETVRSHASIAAARSTYDCACVSTGPSSNDVMMRGSAFVMRADDGGCCSGAAASKLNAGSAAVERSITPRWIRIEGNTLSAKTGRCDVCGMGKGEGPEGSFSFLAPKRMTIAFIRKSAFLKQ